MEQPGKSDSLLLGMEEAFRGIKKVEALELEPFAVKTW